MIGIKLRRGLGYAKYMFEAAQGRQGEWPLEFHFPRGEAMKISPIRAGVAFGLFLAFFHAAWAGLVAAGLAQRLIDFIFWAHFIAPPYQIQPFELMRAAILVGITFLAGLAFGMVGGAFWNMSTRTD